MKWNNFFFILISFLFLVIISSTKELSNAYNVIFRRDVGIEAIHKFVSELKKRSYDKKKYPKFQVTIDKVLPNMKLIKIIKPSEEAFEFITNHKFVKEFYVTDDDNNNDL